MSDFYKHACSQLKTTSSSHDHATKQCEHEFVVLNTCIL